IASKLEAGMSLQQPSAASKKSSAHAERPVKETGEPQRSQPVDEVQKPVVQSASSAPAPAGKDTTVSPDKAKDAVYHARICSFKKKELAVTLKKEVEKKIGRTNKVTLSKDGMFYTVRVHGFGSVDDLKAAMEKLRIKEFMIGKTVAG
ncbi:MAG TPA: SPOR domain-containing protein, partial [Dissulfurispiraceae bacterium]|nr:SPOR domain-containing protein [Dissulfurispiraceae bacterium]